MANAQRGEIVATIGGEEFTLLASLGALAEVEVELGEDFPVIAARMQREERASVRTLLTLGKAFARAAGSDPEALAGKADLPGLAEAVGAAISAAFDTGEPEKN